MVNLVLLHISVQNAVETRSAELIERDGSLRKTWEGGSREKVSIHNEQKAEREKTQGDRLNEIKFLRQLYSKYGLHTAVDFIRTASMDCWKAAKKADSENT